MRLTLALLFVVLLVPLGMEYGFVRAAIALLVFGGLALFGFKYWRDVGLIPPEPELEDVSEQGLKYVCTMCGLELKVEVAARDKAPTHCGEKMELVRTGGSPPLRPV